ncbi:MAG: branched-chain amino acid ABC transporter permease [Proteobacteria bacterium]|nr:branched-chain amino acid ABC transporter permease [Pseudomonadota bacterium]
MTETPRRLIESVWLPACLSLALAICVVGVQLVGSESLRVTLTEMLIRLSIVVGIYIFIGNSGIISFGQIGFMCIGAYATAWATCDPTWKQIMLQGLPDFLREHTYPFPIPIALASSLSAAVAFLFGYTVLRLSGIGASIATFAFLVVVNNVYSNWTSVTGATSSIVGIPSLGGPWAALAFSCLAIVVASVFQHSHFGLMLRASRDDEIAAKASAVDVLKVRLVAFVFSAFLIGAGGSLYAQFLGILTPDMFYMSLTFITLAMLVVGGIGSLTGAVAGTVVVTLIIESLRALENGIFLAGEKFALPQGSQEIGLGIAMALILIFRPQGLVGGFELSPPLRLLERLRLRLGAPAQQSHDLVSRGD